MKSETQKREFTLGAVLERVRSGETDQQDAEALRAWILGDERGKIVEAYIFLQCHIPAVRKYLARDLREQLARALLAEGEQSS
jgi:hypothetical protein